jgi:hypothetical protein
MIAVKNRKSLFLPKNFPNLWKINLTNQLHSKRDKNVVGQTICAGNDSRSAARYFCVNFPEIPLPPTHSVAHGSQNNFDGPSDTSHCAMLISGPLCSTASHRRAHQTHTTDLQNYDRNISVSDTTAYTLKGLMQPTCGWSLKIRRCRNVTYYVTSFMICTPHQILFGYSDEEANATPCNTRTGEENIEITYSMQQGLS